MDVKANKPLDVHCPFISPKPMFRLFNNTTTVVSAATSFQDTVNAGNLWIYTINQIKAASTGATPPYIQVYAWMDDAQLGTNTATQIEITTESGNLDEREVGPVEHFASSANNIAEKLVDVPYVGWYAKASSIFLGGLTKLAAHFGWSKPVIIDKPQYFKLEPFQNGALSIGYDTSKRIVLDPKQELTVDPRVVAEDYDSMSISTICSRPSYVYTASWASSTPIMSAPFYIANVTPNLASYTNYSLVNYVQPSAMAFAAAPFVYWRGDITFRVEVVCSAFHRGKIAIIYEPNNAQMALINAGFDYNKQYIRIIDIQETQNFEFTVNWAAYRAWLKCSSLANTAGNQGSSVSQLGIGEANGYIAITPFTALQSPDGSAASLNIYVYSNDMRFNQLSAVNIPTQRTVPTPGFFKEITVESGVLSVKEEMKYVELNPSTATTDHVSELHFGEQPASFRALLKRTMTNQIITTASYASAAPFLLTVRDLILPQNNIPYNASVTTQCLDLYSYLKYAYLGVRGGIRKRFHLNLPMSATGTMQMRVSRSVPATSSTPTSFTSGTAALRSRMDGSVMYVPSTVGGVEVEFPFYTNNLFFFSFADDPIQGASTEEMNGSYTRDYLLEAEGFGVTGAGTLVADFSAGEDFAFLRFSGAPLYSY